MANFKVDFNEIKARFSFHQVIQLLGLDLKKNGIEWRGSCPNCKGSDRTLVITEGKGFTCFSSKAGGSQLDLVSHVQQVSLREAAEWLDSQDFSQLETWVEPPDGWKQSDISKPHKGFDRAKYQAGLNRTHELLKDIPPELVTRLDLGVPARGSLKDLVNFPLFDSHGTFICYGAAPSISLPKTIK